MSIKKDLRPKCYKDIKEYADSLSKMNNQNTNKIEDYKRYVTYIYYTNLDSIKKIIKAFNNMYKNKKNMRNDTYEFVKTNGVEDFVKFKNEERYLAGVSFYAKPYQKYEKNIDGSINQYQMPAYVMQSITNAIHSKVTEYEVDEQGNIKYNNGKPKIINREQKTKFFIGENQWTFKAAEFINEMEKAALEVLYGEGLFKAIDYPHYLESYYALSKEIVSTDFK